MIDVTFGISTINKYLFLFGLTSATSTSDSRVDVSSASLAF